MFLEINPDFSQARGFLEKIDSHFESENEAIHKGRNTIKKINYDGKDFIVKSFGRPNLLNLLVYGFFRDSKAKRSFQNANKLLASKISTAIPVAYIENKRFGLLHRSFFVAIKVDYDYDFHDINFERKIAKNELFVQFAEFTHQLHSMGFLHLDYTPGNILIKESKSRFQFTIIDINRMRIGPVTWQEGAEALGKIYFKEPWMKTVSNRYAEISKVSEDQVWAEIQKSRQAFERKKQLKKTLRFWRK